MTDSDDGEDWASRDREVDSDYDGDTGIHDDDGDIHVIRS